MPKATKTPRQNRSADVKVRVTPEERRTILAKAEAAGMELSHYVRTALLDAQVVAVPQDTALIRTQNRHLAQFGNNLNQLARHANGYRGAADVVMLTAAIRALHTDWLITFGLDRNVVSPRSDEEGR